ncbi:hypothetical protein NDU88_004849 [Pleurodeles waltl]|uniref:Uncharacterized protein n=1 Tax=Pleurodeles waltl TaxID=8319 RepID=A0AAV7UHV8_PLEWA|nr:hypothetical protein NDU88_004849 [Pleurodeles waltl]
MRKQSWRICSPSTDCQLPFAVNRGGNDGSNGSGPMPTGELFRSGVLRAPDTNTNTTRLGSHWHRTPDLGLRGVGTASYPCTPFQPARGVIKRVIHDVIAAVGGLAGFLRALPHALKISMAPKMARNSVDKTDGAKITRIGKDKGDSAGASRRPISTMAKPIVKNTSGLGKDAKTVDNTTPLLEKTLIEITEPLIKAAEGGDGLSGALDSSVATRRKERGSPISKERPQAQRSENLTGVEATSNTIATLGTEVVQNMPLKPKGWDKEIEKELNSSDWAKDSGDKFYSLTEESDLSSGEHSFSKSGSSVSSETGNIKQQTHSTAAAVATEVHKNMVWPPGGH